MFLYHCTIVLAQICCYHIRILMKEEEHMEKNEYEHLSHNRDPDFVHDCINYDV